MSANNTILQFNVENPPNLGVDTTMTTDSNDNPEENSRMNDNIIFQEDSLDIGKRNKTIHSKAYCGMRGDSVLSGILNITVSAIGGGCFGFPYMMYEGGIIVILLIFLFVTASIYYTIDLLRSFVVDTKYFSFALMTETILGPRWLKTYALSSFIIYVSMVINYLTSIYDYIEGMLGFDNNIFYHLLYFIITIVIEIFICLYITKMANMMHFLSIVSIFCFTLITFSLIVVSIFLNIKRKVVNKFVYENLFFPRISPKTFANKLLKISSYIMEYVFGYSYHSTFPTLIGYLRYVNNSNTKKVHYMSFSIVVFTYWTVTFFGFIFSTDVPKQILVKNDKYFNEGWEILEIPLKIALVIFLLTLIPVRFIVLRDNYVTLFGQKKLSFFSEFFIILLFIFFSNIFVLAFIISEKYLEEWDVRRLVQAFGGMFGVIISFCLPVINYVSVNGKRKLKSIIGYIITGFYVLVGIFSTSYTFYKIFSGDDDDKHENSTS